MDEQEQVNVKIDSKGRLCIPAEIREEIGDTAILKKTPQGYLIVPRKREDFLEEFRKVMTSKHQRTGKPENWSPEKINNFGLISYFRVLEPYGNATLAVY